MGRLEVDTTTALQVQISALTKQLGTLTKNNLAPSGENCNFIGYSNNEFGIFDAGIMGDGCQEQVNFVGNQFPGRQANNPYSNTYNPG